MRHIVWDCHCLGLLHQHLHHPLGPVHQAEEQLSGWGKWLEGLDSATSPSATPVQQKSQKFNTRTNSWFSGQSVKKKTFKWLIVESSDFTLLFSLTKKVIHERAFTRKESLCVVSMPT